MAFTQIQRIRKVDQTVEQAIASYGSFVSLYEKAKARVEKSGRKDWSNDRMLISKAVQALPCVHKVIADKFGQQALYDAINAHPFS